MLKRIKFTNVYCVFCILYIVYFGLLSFVVAFALGIYFNQVNQMKIDIFFLYKMMELVKFPFKKFCSVMAILLRDGCRT